MNRSHIFAHTYQYLLYWYFKRLFSILLGINSYTFYSNIRPKNVSLFFLFFTKKEPNDNTVNVAATRKITAIIFRCVRAASGSNAIPQYMRSITNIFLFSFRVSVNNSGYIFTKMYAISIPYAQIHRFET